MNRIGLFLVVTAFLCASALIAYGADDELILPAATEDVAQSDSADDAGADESGAVWQSLQQSDGELAPRGNSSQGPLLCSPVRDARGQQSPCADSTWRERLKAALQRSHWGYCNYFEERPFGDALVATLSEQVRRGSADMLMLYDYDFYPRGSQRAGELTPRGEWQLSKMLQRMQTVPGPITVQILENHSDLNLRRRQYVVETLAVQGLEHPEQFVVLGRQKYGVAASEALESADNQLDSVKSRGRTIRSGESTTFGGGAASSGFSR